jgi:biotin synthesis protein BioG
MQTTWLHRKNKQECIVFFSGWGMDATPFRCLAATDHDVCMVYDYRHLHFLDCTEFSGYARVHLVAWSMGVWVAAYLLAEQTAFFASRIALAGTLHPIDQQRGLPPDAFAAMIAEFDQQVLEVFYQSMFDREEELARFLVNRPQRQLGALREEMIAFQEAVSHYGPSADIFTHRIISSRDRVFPGRNQLRAWGKGNCTSTPWPHFPFYGFRDWQEIVC